MFRIGDDSPVKQAGGELGQAQLKLGLDFTLIWFHWIWFGGFLFCRFYGKELVW